MPRARVVEVDPTLPHQVRLRFENPNKQNTAVMCNCRELPLGVIPNRGDWRAIYNNPDNHDHTVAPFQPRDRYTADAKVYHVD